MGDEKIRASLEGQDGSTFGMISSHCTRSHPEVADMLFLVTSRTKKCQSLLGDTRTGFRCINSPMDYYTLSTLFVREYKIFPL